MRFAVPQSIGGRLRRIRNGELVCGHVVAVQMKPTIRPERISWIAGRDLLYCLVA